MSSVRLEVLTLLSFAFHQKKDRFKVCMSYRQWNKKIQNFAAQVQPYCNLSKLRTLSQMQTDTSPGFTIKTGPSMVIEGH